jgi:hypothetical protein
MAVQFALTNAQVAIMAAAGQNDPSKYRDAVAMVETTVSAATHYLKFLQDYQNTAGADANL